MNLHAFRVLDGSERIRMIEGELQPVTFRALDDYTRGEITPVTWRERIAHIPMLASEFRRGGGEI